jgi:predicted nucleic acid-binding protein
MTALVFVDTNVFVYAWHTRDLRKQTLASEWLEKLWLKRSGRTSMQVLCECYATLTRKPDPPFTTDEAQDLVGSLLTWNPPPVDADVLTRGFEVQRRYRLNWWDCLIVASAQMQGCSILLTEDLQDRAVIGSLTVRSPFTLGVADDLAAYWPREPTVRVHPRRGRPRKPRATGTAAAG